MKASIKDKILLILGGAFLVVLLGLLGYDLVRKGIYTPQMGLNVLVVGDNQVSILLLRPEEDMVGWVKLPKDVRVKVYNSEAKYPLISLWSYGVSVHDPYQITEKSLGQAMEVVVSRTIKLEDASIENILGKLYSLGLKTNLSIRDRILIRQFLADSVKSKKLLEMAVPSTVFDQVTDPDGAVFSEFNQTMSLWTKNKFVYEPILDENADISINNISGISGMGNSLANQLESTGMHVIEVKADMEEKVSGKGCVYSTGRRYPMTELVLQEQLGCRKIDKPDFIDNDDKLRVWIIN